MRAVERVLRERADSDRPLVEVLGSGDAPGLVLTYRQVIGAARALAGELAGRTRSGVLRVGVVCGNTPAAVIADLALLGGEDVEIPVPLAFSHEQAAGLLEGADLCLADAPGLRRLAEWGHRRVLRPDCPVVPLDAARLVELGSQLGPGAPDFPVRREPGTDRECKIIHTSGTTSRPKGVRIRSAALDALLTSLRAEMPPGAFLRYLSMVPLSLLIEQVTGLYLVLLDGGTVVLLPEDTALVGTAADAARDVVRRMPAVRPTALVAPPAVVTELEHAAGAAALAGEPVVPALFGTDRVPLICCGGAPSHPSTLTRLLDHGVPVYEGYGLSENSSVVSWNTPRAHRPGTVGRPLGHVRVRLGEDGELLVRSTSLFAGYTRDDPSSLVLDADGWLHTGDLAELDADGYLRITGRKKNVIITAAGRNVAPEWVEAQYARLPCVHAAVVFGDGLAALHGLFLVHGGTALDDAERAITAYGAEHLSEVERVSTVHLVHSTEELYRRFFTVTGRPMRGAVQAALLSAPSTPSGRQS
ncbi:AMP-binding protein [Kitasatospora sp. NPDC054939]